jgi:ABC-type phosphate/phosphonate transport system permease subunit
MEGKSQFSSDSKLEFVFGTRKAQKFERPEEAFYFSPHRWLFDVFFPHPSLRSDFMNLDLDLGKQIQQSVSEMVGYRRYFEANSFKLIGIISLALASMRSARPYTFEVSVLYQIFQTFGIAFIGTLLPLCSPCLLAYWARTNSLPQMGLDQRCLPDFDPHVPRTSSWA